MNNSYLSQGLLQHDGESLKSAVTGSQESLELLEAQIFPSTLGPVVLCDACWYQIRGPIALVQMGCLLVRVLLS